ncbi:MAG: GDP-L-fucose synthase [Magnetococcales bacterium]|nr:GDP-L-fucose synthase [Magnetococcales bacterium]
MDKQDRIYVAGHRGMVGAAICRRLKADGYQNILTCTRQELDLTNQADVNAFYAEARPDHVFLAAARVGGIHANNTYPAEFIGNNLMIQTNVIDGAYRHGVKKLLFLGSSCIYPKHAPQPIPEDSLLTLPLEPTNQWYAVAKIAGLKLCQAYRRQYGFNAISVMPTNLYGPEDNFHPENAHVLPALMLKVHKAKIEHQPNITAWGTGSPLREFLHVDDMVDGLMFLMQNYDEEEIINIGVGQEISIRDLVDLMREVVGYEGEVIWDTSKPDGTPRKKLATDRMSKLGWNSSMGFREGLEHTYAWYKENFEHARAS